MIVKIGNPYWLLIYSANKPFTMDDCEHAAPFNVHVYFNGSIHTATRQGLELTSKYATNISVDKGQNNPSYNVIKHPQDLIFFIFINYKYFQLIFAKFNIFSSSQN